MYKCDECGSKFKNRFSYSGHRAHCLGKVDYDKLHNSEKSGFIKETGSFECEYCDKKFTSNQSLYAHISHCKPDSKREQYIFTDDDRKKSRKVYKQNIKNGETIIKGIPHTEETKKVLRSKRIKYMQDNPEKTAWFRRNESKKSYPEKIFEDELINRSIDGWIYDFQNGIYQYDFAWPNVKLDVEIDGSHHLDDEQLQKDNIRDKWSAENGWNVVRYTAKEVLNDVNSVIDELEIILQNMD